jgi:hypothetical protein
MLATRESKLGVPMKAAVVSVPLRAWLLKKPDWLDHQTTVGLTFAVKTFAAPWLALYIAFWAGLDDPRWSFLTVFVVSQSDGGRDRPRHHRNDASRPTAGHCHDRYYDHSGLGNGSDEHAAGLAPTYSASRRYRGRDRCWSLVQVAWLVRPLSSRQRTHPTKGLAMPAAVSWFGIGLPPAVPSFTASIRSSMNAPVLNSAGRTAQE